MAELKTLTATDGTPRLATTGFRDNDGNVCIWDPATGAHDDSIRTPYLEVADAMVAFTAPDGTSRLAIASGDTVLVWAPSTGTKQMLPLETAEMSLAAGHGLLGVASNAGHFMLRLT